MSALEQASSVVSQIVNESLTVAVAASSGGTYDFDVLAFGEQGSQLRGGDIRSIVCGLSELIKSICADVEVLVAPEPGGHLWALAVAQVLSVDLVVLRQTTLAKRSDIVEIRRRTAFSDASLYVPSVPDRRRAVFVDDVISSGRTLEDVVGALNGLGWTISGAVTILAKGSSVDSCVPLRSLFSVRRNKESR